MSQLITNKVFEKSSGIYRTFDSIDHFKFRIILCKLDSLIKIPTFDATISHIVKNNKQKVTNSPRNDHQNSDLAEKTNIKIDFKWQQKLFSNHELNFFSKVENLKNDTDKLYHDMIKMDQLDANRSKNNTIYTLVTRDNLDNYKEFLGNDSNYDRMLNENTNISFMYIVADLKSINKILFVMKYDRSTNIFVIYPDFNKSKPYVIEIKSDSRDLYYCTIKNISKISGATKKNNGMLAKTNYPSSLQFNNLIVDNKFLVLFLFEIKFYKSYFYNFFNSFIFVRYKIIFPNRYNITGDEKSTTNAYESLTNSCKYYFRPNSTIHINFSKEFSVLSENALNFNDNIRIVFTIMALDYWGKPKIIGHTYCVIPVKQGIFDKILYSYTNLAQKNNFYNFDSFNYNADDNLLRYGNETASSGELGIRYNLLIQKNYNYPSNRNSNEDSRKKSKRSSFMKLNDILTAYYEARKRFNAVNI